jgi:ribonuclease HI
MQEPKDVAIYTRGIGLPGVGAFGAVLVCDGHEREMSGSEAGASNNRMDLLAAVEGLAALKWPCRVKLYNSNGYLIDSMAKGWADNRWRQADGALGPVGETAQLVRGALRRVRLGTDERGSARVPAM